MRAFLKSCVLWACTVLTFLPALACRLMVKVTDDENGFFGWSEALSLIPGRCGILLRRSFYRATLLDCHAENVVSFGTVLTSRATRIGSHVFIGRHCVLGACTIEDDTLIASQVSIINGTKQHSFDRLDVPIREQAGVFLPITIGRDSWIGERAVICADVGRHCVIGAGAIVTRPVPDYAVVAGSPAKVIRYRGRSEQSSQSAESEDQHTLTYSGY